MARASAFGLLALLAAAGAGCEKPEPGESRGSTTPRYQRAEGDTSPLAEAKEPVRIGELGPDFAACETHATTRNRSAAAGHTLAVHAAPYEAAKAVDQLPAGATFFICSRSLDQQWFGIVYDEGGTLSDRCGVSDPVRSRRAYEGPCRSGWVSSTFVKFVGR